MSDSEDDEELDESTILHEVFMLETMEETCPNEDRRSEDKNYTNDVALEDLIGEIKGGINNNNTVVICDYISNDKTVNTN